MKGYIPLIALPILWTIALVVIGVGQIRNRRAITVLQIPAEYGEQICYFVVDGNTIDLGYEGERWRRVMFYDGHGRKIGDFTRCADGGMEWRVEIIDPHFLSAMDGFITGRQAICKDVHPTWEDVNSSQAYDVVSWEWECMLCCKRLTSRDKEERAKVAATGVRMPEPHPQDVAWHPYSGREAPFPLEEHEYCRKRLQLRDDVIGYLKEELEQ